MIKSLKRFVMGIMNFIQEYKTFQAAYHTRRLEGYIQSKGCKDTSCIEHWVREFDRKEARNGFL